MRRLRLPAVVVALAACTANTQEPRSIAIRDSAGIQIVEHPAGYEASLPEWRVGPEPLVDIGGQDESSPPEPGHDLDRVRGAARLSDGRIVVSNGGSSELRFFDSTGRFLKSAGRQGQGPGEFAYLGAIQLLPGDTLFLIDGQLRRGSFFDPDGEFIRTIPTTQLEDRHSVGASALMSDGRLLGNDGRFPEMKEISGPVRRDPFAIVQFEPRASHRDTVALVSGSEVYPALGHEGGHEFPTIHSVEFGRFTVFSTDGRRIFVGTNDSDGIWVFNSNGALFRIIRTATPPEPVTEAHRKQRVEEHERSINASRVSEQIKAEWRKMYENPRYAETFPYYERLMPGADGTLWLERVRHYDDEGRRFVVYDSTGRAIATLTGPERMRPYVVGPDLVIGLWRDPDDVHHVRVYRVKREQ
ncbi:MAG: 6-bladed beta-propeller [Gemmatimonadales bacterium]